MRKKAPPHPRSAIAQLQSRVEELDRLDAQTAPHCCHHVVTQPCALPHYPCTLPHQPTITWQWPPSVSSGSTSIIVTKPFSTYPSFSYTVDTQH